MPGTVEALHLAEQESAPTFPVDEATAVPGLGLDGDRLVNKARAAGDGSIEPHRQLTLIEAEALEALDRDYGISLSAAGSRRNVLTRGVSLNHLVGREFQVGAVRARGVKLCEPCGLMERLSGVEGSCKALIHRGGLRAEVLDGGVIRVGDAVHA